jgi:hypothetical protein
MIFAIWRVARLAGLTLAGGLLLASAGVASAGPVSDAAAQAESLLGTGKSADALTAFDQVTDAVWAALPFQFRNILLVDQVSGYGRYQPHQGSTYKAGDKPIIYFEPVGYGFGDADGLSRIGIKTGLEIRTPGGLVLAKTEDFGELEWKGLAKSHEFYGSLSVALPDIRPGNYQLIVTVTDEASGKTTAATLLFDIAA